MLYEDDGVSYDYEQGKQNHVRLKWVNGSGTVEKEGAYAGAACYHIAAWQMVAPEATH
jgi:alpha-D-xyloside xylohydrolase